MRLAMGRDPYNEEYHYFFILGALSLNLNEIFSGR